MIRENTVLILGAGASLQYGFPTGPGLTQQIIQLTGIPDGATVNGRQGLSKTLRPIGFTDSDIAVFRDCLIGSSVYSLDEFLESRTEFIPLGKAAIAAYLLPCETINNLLYQNDDVHWYKYLFSQMRTLSPSSGYVKFEDFANNRIIFITFNYDRSLEMFLFTALKNFYNKSDQEVADKLSQIKIIHVHGSLGKLLQLSPDGLPYWNAETDHERIKKAADSIKIIHEGTEKDEQFIEARTLIEAAKRIYFLGFGYNITSLYRLGMDKLSNNHYVAGTAIGLTENEKTKIGQVNRNVLSSSHFFALTIIDFFKTYNFLV